ncbi:unnamed protein product [Acanthoscelides obtectus]|uniref:CHK kinase-like domain-containing protein n=1 Tax=Acanthoscelides obtectus TaxID=200917 RepID=A0A9P0LZU0_ACAOB|nr:unnamed protein product [Acanthoscelides obtectus]CAK1638593.1 hypothetical protein AOBTE_LOCUS10690 [Acanthoscelides obtectus]
MGVGVPEIKKLDELIRDVVGSDKKIKDVEVSRLTGPGENYGSCMLKVDITLERKSDGYVELLHTVAKLIPELEFFRKVFKIHITVKAEIAFYDVIVPTLQDFQREHGITNVIDCFPKLYAARLNLKADLDDVDEDSVLLFENLATKGFKNINRLEGFDLDGAKLVLKDLASLHAVPLALRLQKPNIFEEKVKAYFHIHEPSPPPNDPDSPKPEDVFLEICKDFGECAPYISEVEKILTHFKENPGYLWKSKPPSETWATLSHGDMWILEELGCNIRPYSYERFTCEAEKFAAITAFRAMFFSMFVVQAKKKETADIESMTSLRIKKEDVNPLLMKKIACAISILKNVTGKVQLYILDKKINIIGQVVDSVIRWKVIKFKLFGFTIYFYVVIFVNTSGVDAKFYDKIKSYTYKQLL